MLHRCCAVKLKETLKPSCPWKGKKVFGGWTPRMTYHVMKRSLSKNHWLMHKNCLHKICFPKSRINRIQIKTESWRSIFVASVIIYYYIKYFDVRLFNLMSQQHLTPFKSHHSSMFLQKLWQMMILVAATCQIVFLKPAGTLCLSTVWDVLFPVL